ncbi:MAG: hypothetical protein FWC36_06450 [Spirochaetes bacterium]|nr:hypothetical protein [Spirochaetota bacterium]
MFYDRERYELRVTSILGLPVELTANRFTAPETILVDPYEDNEKLGYVYTNRPVFTATVNNFLRPTRFTHDAENHIIHVLIE